MISSHIPQVPTPINEPIKEYRPNSAEAIALAAEWDRMAAIKYKIPCVINGKEVFTDNSENVVMPHNHSHVLGVSYLAGDTELNAAADAPIGAQKEWQKLNWQARAAVFLKAADLIAGPYRNTLNAATMLGQSKNCMQAEIDAACELIDFLRFNASYYQGIMSQQPISSVGVWNQLDWRPLEGFVLAITPFNFTAIAGNLPAAPAMLGNTVVWKPSSTQMLSAHIIMQIFKEAGLPDGVINMVTVDGPEAGDVIFNHPDFAGLHFTGSTGVFQHLWKEVGMNINKYKTYPRIVGETGGKDFIIAHKSAHAIEVATAITRGSFEFQGQKCSAASRAYLPSNIANETLEIAKEQVLSMKMGSPEDPSNFINAVIDERSFDKIAGFIDHIKSSNDAEIIVGGNYDKSKGYFIEPTIVKTSDPKYRTMCEEIFGPVMTVFVYDENKYEETLEILDATSEYALTGAVFAVDRYAVDLAFKKLENAAGNFYINDKPTGAVVGQQPFGGARKSGTNDKAGSYLNLLRWVSPRTIKETFVPATGYKYPFLG